jgi:hypothetical protein
MGTKDQKSMKFLLMFDDQTVKQCDFVGPEEYDAIRDGYLDVIRYERGKFEVLEPDGDRWLEIESVVPSV